MYVSGMRRAVVAGAVAALAGSGILLAAGGASAAAPTADGAPAAQTAGTAPAAAPTGRVVANGGLWVHQEANTTSKRLTLLPNGTITALQCKKNGQDVGGNKLWYRLGAGKSGWVAARYVQNLAPVPYCK
ncbi:SH3 domain-containing protein [Streptomyces sp. NBC_00083]|uniref:SH3 domain-containing protein n=1 Tax=Streptomyces sp. NBC_00083 TaxID=2975647 RepID=UPI002258F829|nr:SH3 domain-containing protein [Streptomyces sp. NBC_00083]MCX5384106.1 SH3 domain-containing protein [Streptomyces sp. NBC_00083]